MTMILKTEWASSSLLFDGLFSAVNFTFVIRMQPNPMDPLYVLILQLIESHR
ncbi:hypothetical protein M405DRAFT_824689 [Rhizopogon salebrosus TDB-379]|nr:hypothetical protein M405DRAFT_824689 [Rhizopogon salebrosus TDB-379]